VDHRFCPIARSVESAKSRMNDPQIHALKRGAAGASGDPAVL
jgi:hypothetical protein